MKAIILAAGKSSRLRTKIDSIPKPMVKIHGKPILEHIIELLKEYGIIEIYINLHYLQDVIKDYFANGEKWGVWITYAYEKDILGTAGAVKNLESCAGDSTFMVLYGDNYNNFDLRKIIAFHKEKKALGTIALYERDDVSTSGIVSLDEEGRILQFVEKPSHAKAFSRLVNAGIYIFEPEILPYIPAGQFSDFGHDIFPKIVKEDKSLYGIVMDGILIAIDTPELYDLAMKGD